MSESVVVDEIIAREIVIVDTEGRVRIRLSTAGDGGAEVSVTDEKGAFVSMTAGDVTLGVLVDDGRQSCYMGISGVEVNVNDSATEARIAELERLVERLAERRDTDD